MLNFVICDDNSHTIDNLKSMLEKSFMKYDLDWNIVFTSTKADELLNYVAENKCDVIILDINLHSKLNGLDIADKIREYNRESYLIFTTAYHEYILSAYQYKTFDYLCKPITTERLNITINNLIKDVTKTPKKFIRLDNKNTIIDESEVEYIKRDGMKLIFHTNYRDYEIYSSFMKIKDKLPDNFIRCHKSFIVNVNNITKIEPITNSIYFSNDTCDIGPKYKKELMEVIKNHGSIE